MACFAICVYGKGLEVTIAAETKTIHIQYITSPAAGALLWLAPEQTASKQQPFLFTQSEAPLARSWFPCQDSPGIRFTYDATVKVPSNLLAVMSAGNNPIAKNDSGIYHFSQTNPIPAYLVALAVGDIAFKKIDERCGIYAELPMVDKVAWEFADNGKMVNAAEKLYGPYAWGRYDVLVLPPSFPFGGMENPCLTFSTPTVIAGDRSLVTLVAHELAHSWSGNLITNATWDDFWLNEGFTIYFEQRIMEEVYGKSFSEMQAVLNVEDLKAIIADLGDTSRDTHLKLNLENRDPDDGATDIAYDKGYLFLRLMENTVGRKAWDQFLKNYFATYAFQSMTTEKFVDILNDNLISKNKAAFAHIDINAWIYAPGLPSNAPQIISERFVAVEKEVEKFNAGAAPSALASKNWSTHETMHFINLLPRNLSIDKMKELDATFHYTGIANSEIAAVWYILALQTHYTQANAAIEEFLMRVGRRKFITPLYKQMMKTEEGKKFAKAIYAKARPGYHSLAQDRLDAIVK